MTLVLKAIAIVTSSPVLKRQSKDGDINSFVLYTISMYPQESESLGLAVSILQKAVFPIVFSWPFMTSPPRELLRVSGLSLAPTRGFTEGTAPRRAEV